MDLKTVTKALCATLISTSALAGPFDVTNSEYSSGISHDNNFQEGGINTYENAGNQIIAFIRGFTNYAAEMDEWEYHRESYQFHYIFTHRSGR